MHTSFGGLLEVPVYSHAGKPEDGGLNHCESCWSGVGFQQKSRVVFEEAVLRRTEVAEGEEERQLGNWKGKMPAAKRVGRRGKKGRGQALKGDRT